MAKSKKDVVITGGSIFSALGNSLDDNLYAVWNGKSNFTSITRYDASTSKIKYGGECVKVDNNILPDKKASKLLSRKDILSLTAALSALNNAGLSIGAGSNKFGVFIGAGSNQLGDLTPYYMLVKNCVDMNTAKFSSRCFGENLIGIVNPLVVLKSMLNSSHYIISKTLKAQGANCNYMDFEISSLRAIGEAYLNIKEGRLDVAIAGGVSPSLEPFNISENFHMGRYAETKNTDCPESIIKPYSKFRSGTIPGEGASYIILEKREHAEKRGANILGKIIGVTHFSEGNLKSYKINSKIKNFYAIKKALNIGLKYAGIKEFGFIIGYGNGEIEGDKIEMEGYKAFGTNRTPIMSAKPIFGEIHEAYGAAATLIALDSISKKQVPPTYNFDINDNELFISSKEQNILSDNGAVIIRNFLGNTVCIILSAG